MTTERVFHGLPIRYAIVMERSSWAIQCDLIQLCQPADCFVAILRYCAGETSKVFLKTREKCSALG